MNEAITVDEAISRGHRMVNYPVLIILIGTTGLTFYLRTQKFIPAWAFPIGFVLAFGLAWLWWSFMITKWRLWAFDKVRNVHELKNRAIQEKLIWADNSIFEKTEIRTSTDKQKLISLQSKFKQDDVFHDDLSIQSETVICYSKGGNFVEMIFMLFLAGFGIYLLVIADSYILGLALTLLGAYQGFKDYKEAANTEPQIILNEKGIETINTGFYSWNDIKNEQVKSENSGRNTHYFLTYDHPDGTEHLQIDDYETNHRELNKLLILYRGRNKSKTKNR